MLFTVTPHFTRQQKLVLYIYIYNFDVNSLPFIKSIGIIILPRSTYLIFRRELFIIYKIQIRHMHL